MHKSFLAFLFLLIPMQLYGAKCKVNGKWYPYDHPNCKSNTVSKSDFVMFKIADGEVSSCTRVREIESLEDARQAAISFSLEPNCRVSSEGDYINALCEGVAGANVLFTPDMQSCDRLRSDYQKLYQSK